MDLLVDLLTELVAGLVGDPLPGPSSDRGLVLLTCAGSVGCAAVTAALYLRGHTLADKLLLTNVMIGTAGAVLGALYARRHPTDRVRGILCAVSSVIGPAALWAAWV